MKNYILILNVLLFISCNMNYICKNNDENLKQICNIIVKTWDKNTLIMSIKGIDTSTHKLTAFKDDTRVFQGVIDYISEGDTIVKKEGELKLYVYKKDSIIICNVEDFCNKINDPTSDYLTFIKR